VAVVIIGTHKHKHWLNPFQTYEIPYYVSVGRTAASVVNGHFLCFRTTRNARLFLGYWLLTVYIPLGWHAVLVGRHFREGHWSCPVYSLVIWNMREIIKNLAGRAWPLFVIADTTYTRTTGHDESIDDAKLRTCDEITTSSVYGASIKSDERHRRRYEVSPRYEPSVLFVAVTRKGRNDGNFISFAHYR